MNPIEQACRAAAWPAWGGRPAGWFEIQFSGYALMLAGAIGTESMPAVGLFAAFAGVAAVWAEPVADICRWLR